jgi:hypothetical protein
MEMSRPMDDRPRLNQNFKSLNDVERERTRHRENWCRKCDEHLCYLDFWKGLKDMFAPFERPNLEIEFIARPHFSHNEELEEQTILSKARSRL